MLRLACICLCAMLIFALAGLRSQAEDAPLIVGSSRHALVIGNSSYVQAGKLPNGADDAKAIAAAFSGLGFKTSLGIDVNGSEMRRLVTEFRRRLKPGDISLFYYAGHGLQADGENYLVPIDAILARRADLALEAERLADIIDAMTVEGNTAIVLLDACRNNPFADKLANGPRTRDLNVKTGLAAIDAGTGVYIGFATQPDNVAWDGNERRSPFDAALLRHIATPAVDIEIMMRRVRAEVIETTGGRQIPWSSSSLVEPGFAFSPSIPAGPNDSALDIEFWRSVRDASDPVALRAYLERFPNGAFATLARNRITALANPVAPKVAPPVKAKPVATVRPKAPAAAKSSGPQPKAVTRRPKQPAAARRALDGRSCRDGNIERCRERCAAARPGRQHRGACDMLRKLGG